MEYIVYFSLSTHSYNTMCRKCIHKISLMEGLSAWRKKERALWIKIKEEVVAEFKDTTEKNLSTFKAMPEQLHKQFDLKKSTVQKLWCNIPV